MRILLAAVLVGAALAARADGVDCKERLQGDFSKVTLLGDFANDYGCRSTGYEVDGVTVPDRRRAEKALASAGWAKVGKRLALALAWTRDALFDSRVDSPQATVQKDGSVTVEGWRVLPTGMLPVRHSERVRVTFAPDGTATVQVLETKSTPLK